MEVILLLTLFRLFVPLLILRWPLLGILAAMYLDLQDFNYWTINSNKDMENYQSWDKVMDLYYLSLAFYKSLSWKEMLAKRLSIVMFWYRTLGVIILLFVHTRELLLFFPNIFENFFIFTLIYKKFTNDAKLFTSIPVLIIIIAAITIPKVAAELYLHVLDSPQLLNLPRDVITPFFPTSIESITLYTLYIGPALAVLFARVLHVRKSKS